MEICVWSSGVSSFRAMAILTKERYPTGEKLPTITPMGFMADQAILLHRRMLPHIGSSFLCMAFVTKLIDRIGLYHFIGT